MARCEESIAALAAARLISVENGECDVHHCSAMRGPTRQCFPAIPQLPGRRPVGSGRPASPSRAGRDSRGRPDRGWRGLCIWVIHRVGPAWKSQGSPLELPEHFAHCRCGDLVPAARERGGRSCTRSGCSASVARTTCVQSLRRLMRINRTVWGLIGVS